MSFFDEVKKIPIVDVVRKFTPDLILHGAGTGKQKANCFSGHDKKTMSLTFYEETNSFYCFGCGAGGSTIDYVAAINKDCPVDAAKKIAAEFNISANQLSEDQKSRFRQESEQQRLRKEFISRCHAQITKEQREILNNRGITDKTIDQLKIGYECQSNPNSLEEAKRIGLLSTKGKYLPQHRIILPVWKNNKPTYVIFYDPNSEQKYINQIGQKPLVGLSSVEDKEVYLVEGYFDHLSMIQNGFNSLCTLGNRLTKPSLSHLKKAKRIFITYDGDTGGERGSEELAKDLYPKCRLLTLPTDKDPNDILKDNPDNFKTTILELTDKSKSWLDVQTEKAQGIEESWKKKEFINEELIPLFQKLDEASQYEWYKENEKLMPMTWSILKKRIGQNQADNKTINTNKSRILDNLNEDIRILHPALDFTKEVAVIGGRIDVPTIDKNGEKDIADVQERLLYFFSDGNKVSVQYSPTFEIEDQSFVLKLKNRLLPEIGERWSSKNYKDVVKRLQPPVQVYEQIKHLSKKNFEFHSNDAHAFVSAYIIATYFHPIFDAFPYIHAYGPKGTGKSKLLEFFQKLCFNALKIQEITVPAIGDSVESLRATLCIDQAEKLSNPEHQRLISFLADGYKKEGAKRRVVDTSKSRQIREFSSYSPKVFGSIKPIHYDLADRCITILTKKADRTFPTSLIGNFESVRSDLYRLALSKFKEISEIKSKISSFKHRERELWTPIESVLLLEQVQTEEVDSVKTFFSSAFDDSEPPVSALEEKLFFLIIQKIGDDLKKNIDVQELTESLKPLYCEISDRGVGNILKKFALFENKSRPRIDDPITGIKKRKTIYTFDKGRVLKIACQFNVMSMDDDEFVHNQAPVHQESLKFQIDTKNGQSDRSISALLPYDEDLNNPNQPINQEP